jgi:hypothetical protein
VTLAQQDLTTGFLESLARRGVMLNVQGSAVLFRALVEPISPVTSEFSLGDNEREASRVHVLRTELPPDPIGFATYLEHQDTNKVHRVSEIFDHPTKVAVVFSCDTIPKVD